MYTRCYSYGGINFAENDPEIREVFKVSYGIDERGLYPDGAPYTDEMKIQVGKILTFSTIVDPLLIHVCF